MANTSFAERGVMDFRKRKLDDPDIKDVKRPRTHVYFRLESESSVGSDNDDTETVYSIQGKETDIARDSSDADSRSDIDSDDLEVEIEYDVASLSSIDGLPFENDSSSGTEDVHLSEDTIAAVLYDSSLEAWSPAGDTSSTTASDPNDFGIVDNNRTDFWTCVQCKSQNNNPLFRYCEPCFQRRCWRCKKRKSQCFPLCTPCFKVRKNMFPPRPRGTKKRKRAEKDVASTSGSMSSPKVNLETVQSCIKRLSEDGSNFSQDSGIGSSQELPQMDFNKIVVPDGALLDDGPPPAKKAAVDIGDAAEKAQSADESGLLPDSKELCIVCNVKAKDGIFLHGSRAHMCCCYKCAVRVWRTTKRCPICNGKVKNVVKLFT